MATTQRKTNRTKMPNGLGPVKARGKGMNGYKNHPYLSLEFWAQPANRFWNTAMYSPEVKAMFDARYPATV